MFAATPALLERWSGCLSACVASGIVEVVGVFLRKIEVEMRPTAFPRPWMVRSAACAGVL